jgi:hypothetical protein
VKIKKQTDSGQKRSDFSPASGDLGPAAPRPRECGSDAIPHDSTSDWAGCAQRFHIREWLQHEEMLQAASECVRLIRKHPSGVRRNDLVKILDLASVLGRRACGMPIDPAVGASG